MSKLLGTKLPEALLQRLSGTQSDACAEKAIPICTVDKNGFPHPAILSYFEVVAKNPTELRLALYKDSSTMSNIRRDGKLTMQVFDERTAYYIKGVAKELVREMAHSPYNSLVGLRVEQVLVDEANEELEPGVYITSGVTYKRPLIPAQTREVLQELLARQD